MTADFPLSRKWETQQQKADDVKFWPKDRPETVTDVLCVLVRLESPLEQKRNQQPAAEVMQNCTILPPPAKYSPPSRRHHHSDVISLSSALFLLERYLRSVLCVCYVQRSAVGVSVVDVGHGDADVVVVAAAAVEDSAVVVQESGLCRRRRRWMSAISLFTKHPTEELCERESVYKSEAYQRGKIERGRNPQLLSLFASSFKRFSFH